MNTTTNSASEELAELIQQFWQGPSGRPWNDGPDSCCAKLPAQAEWFRLLANKILEKSWFSAADFLDREYPDNANTNAFAAAIRASAGGP